MFLNDSITVIHTHLSQRPHHESTFEFFLFGENENENLPLRMETYAPDQFTPFALQILFQTVLITNGKYNVFRGAFRMISQKSTYQLVIQNKLC